MSSWREHRSIAAFAVVAALTARCCAIYAQVPSHPAEQPAAIADHSQPGGLVQQPQPSSKELGDALMIHQRYQAAIEAYKKVPGESAEVLNQMGIAYQMMFNLDEAVRSYQASLKLEPNNANVMNNLGTVYDSLKQYSSAERMYRKALKIVPQSPLIEKNLGTSLLAQHHYKKGWEAYQAALALDPQIFQSNTSPRVDNLASVQDRGAMNYYMARGCIRAGQTECAIDYLRMALNEGFTSPKKIQADSEFAGLRGLPAFEKLIAAQGTP